MALIQDNLEDMHKVLAYLLEKETITGGEMVAIIEGRDPALVEDAYASTRQSEKKKPLPGDIEPPAKNIHIGQRGDQAPHSSDEGTPARTARRTPGSSRAKKRRNPALRRSPNAPQGQRFRSGKSRAPPLRTKPRNNGIKTAPRSFNFSSAARFFRMKRAFGRDAPYHRRKPPRAARPGGRALQAAKTSGPGGRMGPAPTVFWG